MSLEVDAVVSARLTPLGRERLRLDPVSLWLQWEMFGQLITDVQRALLQQERLSGWEQADVMPVIEAWVSERTGLYGNGLRRVAQRIDWELFGWGILEPLIADESVTDIMASAQEIWIQQDGVKRRLSIRFRDEEHMIRIARKIAHAAGQSITVGEPFATCAVRGMRINVMIPPVSAEGTTIIVRKYRERRWTEQAYLRAGTLNSDIWRFLSDAMKAGLTGIISGPMGSGKTTLLQSLIAHVPDGEGILVAETVPELFLKTLYPSKCIISVIPRLRGHESSRVSLEQLFENALHQNVRRFIFGEIRGAETALVLEAFQTGHSGWTTMHGDDPKDTAQRLVHMCLRSQRQMDPEYTGKMIAHAVDLIVQMRHYRVTEVAEVTGYRNCQPETAPLYVYEDGCWVKRESPSSALLAKIKRGIGS
ncbi:CpaF family protein [Paenibacillus chartarius]|uniref:CpaF family protein n=1 Tax=Paenibacillus chartarius TaxID=747481 RepID=A0ABV6DMF9_9BACL